MAEADATLIAALVAALPEMYQPIFGHPELSVRVRRPCEDRLVHIIDIYRQLEAKLGRPLRVLDLGCAQGFFSLSLAKLGATVFGVDFQMPNIAVCRALAAENPDCAVDFHAGFLEEIIAALKQDHYDLVLGLSVFHHLVHHRGIGAVQNMLAALAEKTSAGIFEMALASEPPYWAAAQPENPRLLLSGYAFAHAFAQNHTHLSAIRRPLYVASNRYWFLGEQAQAFDSWAAESHALANNASRGTRRYFFGKGRIAKVFALDMPELLVSNLSEYDNEVAFLDNRPTPFRAPEMLARGKHEREVWLVRELLPGELLLDKIRAKKSYDARRIITDVLDQLAALEATGLYHNDVRTWNVLVDDDGGALLIDYGAISNKANDCVWPHNLFLSFMIFVRETMTGGAWVADPLRPASFNPEGFAEPHQSAFRKLFELPPQEWRFSYLRDIYAQAPQKKPPVKVMAQEAFFLVVRTLEDACGRYQKNIRNWRHRAVVSENLVARLQQDESVQGAGAKAEESESR